MSDKKNKVTAIYGLDPYQILQLREFWLMNHTELPPKEPKKKETAEDVLRAIVHDSEKMQDYVLTPQEIERAKAALGEE